MSVFKNKLQQGFTAIELIIVLALAAGIAIYALRGVLVSSDATKVSNTVSMIKDVQKGAAGFVGGNGVYTNINIANMNARNLLPNNIDDGIDDNPFGGDVTVAVVAANPTQYTIAFTEVPAGPGADLQAKFDGFTTTYADGTFTLTVGD